MMDGRRVVIDIESYDPEMDTLGNGAIRHAKTGEGQVLVSGLYDGKKYTPCRPDTPSWDFLKDTMKDASITKIAHNGVYDYDWTQNGYGLSILGRMEDTMTREGLINEYSSHYDLDSCCQREGVTGKDKDGLDEWWKRKGGQGSVMKNLILLPNDIVEKYNEQDCKATWDLFHAQQPKLDAMKLNEINDLECEQFPVILKMRANGIRVDVPRINQIREQTQNRINEVMNELAVKYGLTSLTARKGDGALPTVLINLGLRDQLLRTGTGDVSVAYDSLVRCDHPIIEQIIEMKRKQTLLDKYLNSAFTKFIIGEDRIHGTFKPTQRDEGGTITGRYSSSEPNMQNFTSREQKGGEIVRGVFIPDENCWLVKADYSQIEYRIFAHIAVGPGSLQLRDQIQHGADYHQIVMDMLGWHGKDMRKVVKQFNFGMIYGMGLNRFKEYFAVEARKAAAEKGMTTDDYTTTYYNEYMRRMAFVRPTMQSLQATASAQGYLRSIGGRLHRNPPDGAMYKMVNYYVQGSAADINKMALRDCNKAGVFDELKIHLTVHDEVVASVPKTKAGLEAVEEMCHLMENVVELKVPIEVDPGIGKNWFLAGAEKRSKRNFKLLKERLGA